jgi:hypothetical protein
MFEYFPVSIGVANVSDFQGRLEPKPAHVASNRSGAGFAEVVEVLLSSRGLR